MDAGVEERALALLEEALRFDPEEREAFVRREADGDDALRQRALRLLGAVDEQGDWLPTGGVAHVVTDAPAPEQVGAYRIVEALGEGGMGAVYRAVRDSGDFDHEVAIKIVRPGILGGALKDRFERERQLLANLSHPHIARLYDGGTMEGGSPYIVMELIDGMPIDRWTAEQDLDRDARLALFEQVCGAVRFAHQNLVIHRDITPANILVTPDGQPKLIDFGIAKPTELEQVDAEPEQEVIALSMTPGFAAPERKYGAPATTLTDIYSLGKVLALLMEPDEGDSDIAAVIGRAAAEDPEQRYRSADALIDDVQRLRDGRPVAAREGGRGYHIVKFLKRRKLAVAVAAAMLVLLVGGLIATSIGFQRARVAQAQAEERFDQIRSLSNRLLFDIYDEVDAIPGSTSARRMLASTAQEYLNALASDPDAPPSVRLDAGRGFMRLADVMGGAGGGNLGLREAAERNYERSDTILTALHQEIPDDREVALALADLRYARSIFVVQTSDDMERGLGIANSIAPILERVCGEGDDCIQRRAQALIAQANSQYWLDNLDTAFDAFSGAIAALESMSPDRRRTRDVTRLRALALRLRGDTRYYLDELSAANEDYERAISILQSARRAGMNDPNIRRDLALVHWSRGGTLDELDRVDDAVAALDEAYAIVERLVEADPDDEGTLRLLAVIGGQRGLTLSSAGRFPEAIASAEASLAIRQRLSRMQPDQQGYFRDVAIQLNGLGDIHVRAGNQAAACRYFRQTIERFDALDARGEMSDFDRGDTYARAKEALRSC